MFAHLRTKEDPGLGVLCPALPESSLPPASCYGDASGETPSL